MCNNKTIILIRTNERPACIQRNIKRERFVCLNEKERKEVSDGQRRHTRHDIEIHFYFNSFVEVLRRS